MLLSCLVLAAPVLFIYSQLIDIMIIGLPIHFMINDIVIHFSQYYVGWQIGLIVAAAVVVVIILIVVITIIYVRLVFEHAIE